MLDGLNPIQNEQIKKQIEAYESIPGPKIVHIPLGEQGFNLEVDPFVANPEIMNSGIQVAEYMVDHPELFKNKVVTDIGTGSGILGVAAGLLNAKHVFMSDIDPAAVHNAQKNITMNNLSEVCEVFKSDLFTAYSKDIKSDVQIFNHPYFSAEPLPDKPWTRMMLADPKLLEAYLTEAPKHSTADALYLLSWLSTASNEDGVLDNDPAKVAPGLGYEIIKVTQQEPVKLGIQQALFKIYELKHKTS